MPNCAISGCTNYSKKTSGTDIKFYRFPKNEDLSKQWIQACSREDKINLNNARICSIHFSANCFQVSLKNRLLNYLPTNYRDLKDDALPTENLPKKSKSVYRANLEVTTKSVNNIAKLKNRTDIIAEILNMPAPEFRDVNMPAPELRDVNMPSGKVPEAKVETVGQGYSVKTTGVVEEMRDLKIRVNSLEEELELLKSQYAMVNTEKETLASQLADINANLGKHFTPGQIKRLLNPLKKYQKWDSDDIAAAISLRSVSPKAYRYLRSVGYPLPALSTLRKWALSLDVSPGILKDVIQLMKQKSTVLNPIERVAVLTFDEVYISNKLTIDQKTQQVLGSHKTSQVVMIRGLFSPWKQPIFYDFDTRMTKEILIDIIAQLHSANYTVVAIASDMGTGNVALWSELGIGHDTNCFFYHPVMANQKIFVFADVPHLLKLIRNHLLDQGFFIDDKEITKWCIQKIVTYSTSDLKIAHKISDYHLTVKGTERQKVRPAAQMLSNTVAKAIEWCGNEGFFEDTNITNWQETSQFVKIINDWFDIFNAQTKYGAHPGANAFGIDLEKQISVLKQTSDIMTKMTVGKHKTMLPFQKGVVLSNNSLVGLYEYLKEQYDIQYILTYRLNQDILENFFSYIRAMGAANDQPSPLDLKYRLRWYILGKHSKAVFSMNKNAEDSTEPCLIAPFESTNSIVDKDVCLSQELLGKVTSKLSDTGISNTECEDMLLNYTFTEAENEIDGELSTVDSTDFQITQDHENLLKLLESNKISDTICNEGLKYIAGYVAYRFTGKYPNIQLGNKTKIYGVSRQPDWIEFLSRGDLIYPSNELIELARKVEQTFQNFHGNLLSKEKMIFNKLENILTTEYPEIAKQFPRDVVMCLIRTRTYIRLRNINKKISFENCRRKIGKKISKFTNAKR